MAKKLLHLVSFVGVVGLALLFGGVGQAEAGPITFNFNTLSGSNSTQISTYMTGIYGSQVTVTGAKSSNNSDISPPPPIPWTGNATEYIRLMGSPTAFGDFEISFDVVPIASIHAGSLGFVFDETSGNDFTLSAYDSTYGDRENPNGGALVYHQAWNSGTGQINIPDVFFSRPVTLLVFSDSGVFDVGIDDLKVTPVPEPSSLILIGIGLLGLFGYGYRRRKQAA